MLKTLAGFLPALSIDRDEAKEGRKEGAQQRRAVSRFDKEEKSGTGCDSNMDTEEITRYSDSEESHSTSISLNV